MWHAVVISCPLHKMSHVAQLFHGQTPCSVKHCLLLFLSLPASSAARVTVTTSQRAHTTPGVEKARFGLQLCGDTIFPTASPRAGDTQRYMGLQKAEIFFPTAIFALQIERDGHGWAARDAQALTPT